METARQNGGCFGCGDPTLQEAEADVVVVSPAGADSWVDAVVGMLDS